LGSTDRPDLAAIAGRHSRPENRRHRLSTRVRTVFNEVGWPTSPKLVELFRWPMECRSSSVTRQFNTTTSMGRPDASNVLLVLLPQFERECYPPSGSADKNRSIKAKGACGSEAPLPLGYEMKDGKIAVVEEEAELVRLIFRRYLELGSVNRARSGSQRTQHSDQGKKRAFATGRRRAVASRFGRGAFVLFVGKPLLYIGRGSKYKNEILPARAASDHGSLHYFDAVRQKILCPVVPPHRCNATSPTTC